MAMASTLRISTAALAAAALGIGGIWAAMDRPDALIERSFAGAFDRLESTAPARAAVPLFDPAHLHLSRLPASSPMAAPVALGDRMTIAGRGGAATTYEVIELRPLPAGSGTEAGDRLLMVTATTIGQAPVQTIRFIVEAGNAPAVVPAKPHAL
jgi:hypothetical protein